MTLAELTAELQVTAREFDDSRLRNELAPALPPIELEGLIPDLRGGVTKLVEWLRLRGQQATAGVASPYLPPRFPPSPEAYRRFGASPRAGESVSASVPRGEEQGAQKGPPRFELPKYTVRCVFIQQQPQ